MSEQVVFVARAATAAAANSSRWRLKPGFAAADLSIRAGRIYVVTKTTFEIHSGLSDLYPSRQEDDGDLAWFGVVRLKLCDIAIDKRVAAGVTHVETLRRRINPIELDLKLVMAERQYAELAFAQAVNSVDLRGGHHLFSGRLYPSGWLRLLRSR